MKIKENYRQNVDSSHYNRRVEQKAYELYVQRGAGAGLEWEDWFKAEKIVGSDISTVDKDCIRSENLYKASHRSNPLPSEIDAQKININPLI